MYCHLFFILYSTESNESQSTESQLFPLQQKGDPFCLFEARPNNYGWSINMVFLLSVTAWKPTI